MQVRRTIINHAVQYHKKEGQLAIRMHMGEYIEAKREDMAARLSTKYNVGTIYKL